MLFQRREAFEEVCDVIGSVEREYSLQASADRVPP